ncbi:MAG: DNRLRE domain-containing protein, partial [Clostridiales bacterium]|nr:DNRLRE domain-containing protein [Clostridiales bacterium]
MKKALCFILSTVLLFSATGFTGIFAQPAFVGESTKQFQDFFEATPLREDIGSTLDPNAWGAQTVVEWSNTQTVGARDQNNGLEDKNLGDANKTGYGNYWDYWDGSIIKADDGTYHIFSSRWDKAYGHETGWTRHSTAIHAVSDNLYGPYEDLGLAYDDVFNNLVGAGHNVAALELQPDDASGYRYAITTSGDVAASGNCWGSNDLYHWERIGSFFKAEDSTNVDFGGNFVVMCAPEDNEYGKYISIGRQFEVATADHIQGPWTLRFRGFDRVPGSPTQDMEDPLMFYMDGLYHAVFNQWSTMRAFWYISENGVDGWELQPGYAYNPRQDLIYYENEQGEKYHVNHWGKMERPYMYMENGLPVAMSFDAINSRKVDDRNLDDNNGSKIVVIPFDGEAFRDYVRTKVTRGATDIPAKEDAYVAANAQTSNFGSATALAARTAKYTGDHFGETTPVGTDGAATISYLKFDLSQYANAAAVGAAQLELMYTTKSGFPTDVFDELYVVSAGNDWTETGITWQNKPALDFESGVSVSSPIDLNYSNRLPRLRVTADVTDLVNSQLKQGNTEITLAFSQTLEVSQNLSFDSRQSTNEGFRPTLSVVEQPDLSAAIADAEAALAAKMPDVFALPKTAVNAALRAVIDKTRAIYNDETAIGVDQVVTLRVLDDALTVFKDAYAALDGLLGL